MHAALVEAGKLRELEAWEKFDVSPRMMPAKNKNKLVRPDGY